MDIYVDPQSGSDTATGSPASPLKTLNRASSLLQSLSPDEDVTVRIAPCDVAINEQIVWRYSHPEYKTRIRGPGSSSARFNGNGIASDILRIAPLVRGIDHKLQFGGFRLSNGLNGIVLAGDRNDPVAGFVSGVTLHGIYIDRIGNKYADGEYGAGAIRLVNSRGCLINKCQTHYLENNGGKEALMHAVYAAHYSSDNIIQDSRTSRCSGDPFRTRDRSCNNKFMRNTLTRCGSEAIYSDWFCTGSACTKPGGECPSYGNELRDNVATWAGYRGNVALFAYHGTDNHCGALPAPRLRTSGNSRI